MSETYHNKDILEFVTVALEFCKRLERVTLTTRSNFVDIMLKLLPLLYLKAQIVLRFEPCDDVYIEHIVTEVDYDAIRNGVAAVMGEYDDFLDVFVEDMKYSDTPILCTISENLSDIYQELRDFLGIYEQNFDESTAAALGELSESFSQRWGQFVVNVMRPLHEVMYTAQASENDNAE